MSWAPDVLLFDGNAFIHRGYHAGGGKEKRAPNRHPNAAVTEFYKRVTDLALHYKDAETRVVFDAPGTNFRHRIDASYKATRPSREVELSDQFEVVHELTHLLGFRSYIIPDVEADDVIATLAIKLSEQHKNVLILSSDKDLMQLVSPYVHQLTLTGQHMDETAVRAKYQLAPSQILDLLALQGDAADNIPGVPKVGLKTATKWLQKWGSLEGIISNKEAIGGAVGISLRDNIDKALLSKRLATLKKNTALDSRQGVCNIEQLTAFKIQWGITDSNTATLCQATRFDYVGTEQL